MDCPNCEDRGCSWCDDAHTSIDEQLRAQHMRRAGRDEAGWHMTVIHDRDRDGEPCKVWATYDDRTG